MGETKPQGNEYIVLDIVILFDNFTCKNKFYLNYSNNMNRQKNILLRMYLNINEFCRFNLVFTKIKFIKMHSCYGRANHTLHYCCYSYVTTHH